MNIEDYFDTERTKKKVVMLDWNNLAYRYIFGAYNQYMNDLSDPNKQMEPEDLYTIWKNYMVENIFDFIATLKPDRLIIAVDSKSWRKAVYPEYKGGRDTQRKKSAVDFDVFHPIMNAFVDELKNIIPNAYVLRIADCEVDDIIAVLSKRVFNEDDVVIVSGDGDFKQLLTNKNVRIFNPDAKVKNFVECLNPKEELDLKIVIGDGGNGQGDNIPNILVMEGIPFEGKTIGCGEVTAKEILEHGLDSEYVIQKVAAKYNTEINKKKKEYAFDKISKEDIVKKIKANYERNLKLISFEQIPLEIEKKIIEGYENHTLGKFSAMTCLNILFKNKINRLAQNLQSYGKIVKELS